MATPLTNMHYLGSQRGAMYSAEHNLERFYAEAVARNRCNTPVKNLYISGMKFIHPAEVVMFFQALQQAVNVWCFAID